MAGPLAGIRVLELGALVAAPLCATLLADQGAEVIKLEPPGAGDLFRHVGSHRGGMSGIFAVLNRGKRSLALSLSDPRGVELCRELAARADVLVQNLRPGVVERIGVGPSVLCEANPRLVYVSLSGFGQTGPYAAKRVYDNVIQTYAGVADGQTNPASGEPEFVRQLFTDKLTAVVAAQAACAALVGRAATGRGQRVELAMLDAAIAFLWPDRASDLILQGEGIAHQPSLGRDFKLWKLADGYGTATPFTDAEFQGLCRALELPDVASDPKLASTALRMQNFNYQGKIMRERMEPAAAKLTCAEFERRLAAEDVPHGVARRLEELHDDPQVRSNRSFRESVHPLAGAMREPRHAAHFLGTPLSDPTPAPALGEHSDAVLAELGCSAARIAELRAAGVVA
jgi:crotonobetainyl-CoA:carnitine CoA-transferase CaiB-like acyl-CoA transferase